MNDMNNTTEYNGWANRETWNVALWIANDYFLYSVAVECKDYAEFQAEMCKLAPHEKSSYPNINIETPDGVSWTDSNLDIKSLDVVIKEIGVCNDCR